VPGRLRGVRVGTVVETRVERTQKATALTRLRAPNGVLLLRQIRYVQYSTQATCQPATQRTPWLGSSYAHWICAAATDSCVL
jgi:hypothetical protein